MKKTWWMTVMVVVMMVLAACGSDSTDISEESENTTANNDTEETTEETTEEEVVEEVEEAVEVTDEDSADVQEDDSIKATNTYTDKEVNITGEMGSIQYEITGIQLKIIEPKDQMTADLFEVEIGEEVHAFTVALAGENTSDEDMMFYLGQATAITNTKEQLDPDMWMSEYIDGDYLGQVRHEGYNIYILNNSTVDELETIELRIGAPMNSNYDLVGEDASHTIEVNN